MDALCPRHPLGAPPSLLSPRACLEATRTGGALRPPSIELRRCPHVSRTILPNLAPLRAAPPGRPAPCPDLRCSAHGEAGTHADSSLGVRTCWFVKEVSSPGVTPLMISGVPSGSHCAQERKRVCPSVLNTTAVGLSVEFFGLVPSHPAPGSWVQWSPVGGPGLALSPRGSAASHVACPRFGLPPFPALRSQHCALAVYQESFTSAPGLVCSGCYTELACPGWVQPLGCRLWVSLLGQSLCQRGPWPLGLTSLIK